MFKNAQKCSKILMQHSLLLHVSYMLHVPATLLALSTHCV